MGGTEYTIIHQSRLILLHLSLIFIESSVQSLQSFWSLTVTAYPERKYYETEIRPVWVWEIKKNKPRTNDLETSHYAGVIVPVETIHY